MAQSPDGKKVSRPKVAPMSEDALRASEVRSLTFVAGQLQHGARPPENDSVICSPADGGDTPANLNSTTDTGYVFPQDSGANFSARDVTAPPTRKGTAYNPYTDDAAAKFMQATRAFAEGPQAESFSLGHQSEPPSILLNNFFGARPEKMLSQYPPFIAADILPTVLCASDEECVGAYQMLLVSLLEQRSPQPSDTADDVSIYWFKECIAKLPVLMERLQGRGESNSVAISINTFGKVRKNVESLSEQRIRSVKNGPLTSSQPKIAQLPVEAFVAAADAFLAVLRLEAIRLIPLNNEADVRSSILLGNIHAAWPQLREQALNGMHPSSLMMRASSARFLSSEYAAATTSIDVDSNGDIAMDAATELQSWCLLVDQSGSKETFRFQVNERLKPTTTDWSALLVVTAGYALACLLGILATAVNATIGVYSTIGCICCGLGVYLHLRWNRERETRDALHAELFRALATLGIPTNYRTPVAASTTESFTAAPSNRYGSSAVTAAGMLRSDPMLNSSSGDQMNPEQLKSGFLLSKRSAATMSLQQPPPSGGTLTVSMDDTRNSGVAKRRTSATPNPLSQMLGLDDDGLVRVRMDATGTLLLPFMDDATNPIVLDGFHVHAHLCIIGVEFSKIFTSLEERSQTDVPEDRCFVCLWNHAIVVATGGFTDQAVISNNLNDVLEDSASVRILAARIAEIEAEVLEPTHGFSTDPVVLSFLHREHGSVKMRMTLAPVTQTVVVPGEEPSDVMVGALLIGVPLDVRSSVASMTLRNRYLSEVVEQYYLEATAVSHHVASRNHHRDFNERAFAMLLDSLRRVSSLPESGWKSCHSRCFTQELPDSVRSAVSGAQIVCQIDKVVPDVVDLDLQRITSAVSKVVSIGKPSKLYSILVSVPASNSSLLMVRLIGVDVMRCTNFLVGDDGDPIAALLRDSMACLLATSVPTDELDPSAMTRQTSFTTGALTKVFSGLIESGEVECVYLLFPFRRSTGSDAGWLAQVANDEGLESPVLKRQNSVRVGASVSLSASMALGGGATEPMSVMVCADSEIARHKLSLALWSKSHSVIQIEDDDFIRSGQRILRSGNRRVDAVVMTRFQPITAELLRCCSDFIDVAFCIELPSDESGGNLALPAVPKRRRSLQSGSDMLQNMELNGSGDGREALVESLRKLVNVVFVSRAAHAPRFASDIVQAVTKVVGKRRNEIKKREAIETLLKERRAMPWAKGKQLGRGTFGAVFEAEMTLTGGKMAVKVMHCGNNESKQKALYNEIKVLLAVQHPNIVHYFHSERGKDGEVNIFMELCTGGNLASLVANKSTVIDLEEVASMMDQILSALEYMHEVHNLAHRDLKPANVLMSNGKLKLADFGTAVTVTATELNDMAGTMQYMAPEVFAGEPYGKPCDVWSAGVICLDLLRISPPCMEKYGLYCLGSCENDTQLWEGLQFPTDAARDFVFMCLRVKPEHRWTATQLVAHPFLKDARATFGLKPKQPSAGASSAAAGVPPTSINVPAADRGAFSISDESDGITQGLIRDLRPAEAFQEGANQWKSRFLGSAANATNLPTPAAGPFLALKPPPYAASPSANAKHRPRLSQQAAAAVPRTSLTSMLVPTSGPMESEASIPVPQIDVQLPNAAVPSKSAAPSLQSDPNHHVIDMLPGQDLGPSVSSAFAGVRNDNLVLQDSVLSDF